MIIAIPFLDPFLQHIPGVFEALLGCLPIDHYKVVGDKLQKLEAQFDLGSSPRLNPLELISLQHVHESLVFLSLRAYEILVEAVGLDQVAELHRRRLAHLLVRL